MLLTLIHLVIRDYSKITCLLERHTIFYYPNEYVRGWKIKLLSVIKKMVLQRRLSRRNWVKTETTRKNNLNSRRSTQEKKCFPIRFSALNIKFFVKVQQKNHPNKTIPCWVFFALILIPNSNKWNNIKRRFILFLRPKTFNLINFFLT